MPTTAAMATMKQMQATPHPLFRARDREAKGFFLGVATPAGATRAASAMNSSEMPVIFSNNTSPLTVCTPFRSGNPVTPRGHG